MKSAEQTPARSGWAFLIVLTLINLVNYLDRYVVSAVLPLMKTELALSDTVLGSLATAFMVSYVALSPFAGQLGDRYPRKYLIAACVFIWSLATIASGLAKTYPQLLLARSFTGIGEAGYATVAPSIVSDLFHKERRGSALSIFYAALPVGSALGFTLGGYWGTHFGWRTAFFLAGGPGILCSIITLMLKEPRRGALDVATERIAHDSIWSTTIQLLRTKSLRYINLGMAMFSFAVGGLAFWAPTFLNRVRNVELSHASFVFGMLTVIGGFAGTLAGGWLSDRLRPLTRKAYMLIPGISLLLAFPPLLVFFRASNPHVYWSFLLISEFFLFMNTGPLNAAIINVVLPEQRARAMAVNILAIHILGDAPSPLIIGMISDSFGLLFAAEVISTATLLGGILLWYGSRHLQKDEDAIADKLLSDTA